MSGVGFDAEGRPLKTFPVDDQRGSESIQAVTLVDTSGLPLPTVYQINPQYMIATYASDLKVNQCVKISSGVASPVTSLDTDAPWVDGVVVQGGSAGSKGIVALSARVAYTTPINLAQNRLLFLGQDGLLVSTPPARESGDLWSVTVAQRTADDQYILNPQIPIALISI